MSQNKKLPSRIPSVSEDEAENTRPPPRSNDQTRPKARPIKRKEVVDSDIEMIEPPGKARGKRKASQDDSADDEGLAAENSKRAGAKKANVGAPKKSKAPKKGTFESEPKNQKIAGESSQAKISKSAVKARGDSPADDEQDLAPKKKKRKLNVGIFPSTQQQPPQFQWDQVWHTKILLVDELAENTLSSGWTRSRHSNGTFSGKRCTSSPTTIASIEFRA